jgi:hypothetical protein
LERRIREPAPDLKTVHPTAPGEGDCQQVRVQRHSDLDHRAMVPGVMGSDA